MAENPHPGEITVAEVAKRRIKNPHPVVSPEPIKKRIKAGEQPKAPAKKTTAKKATSPKPKK